eukprot:2902700-Amphidinium_carterae.2
MHPQLRLGAVEDDMRLQRSDFGFQEPRSAHLRTSSGCMHTPVLPLLKTLVLCPNASITRHGADLTVVAPVPESA